MNSNATLEGETLDHTRSDSEPAPSGVFPQSVNWNNPRVAAILGTAAECFSRGGFSTTTLADIGRELGLRKSIVHYYFTSKATLVKEVQNFAYGRYLEVIRSALSGPVSGRVLASQGEVTSEAGPSSGLDLTSELRPRIDVSSPESKSTSALPELKELWSRLGQEKSIGGLNLELWSEARRDPELSERAESFESEAQKLISKHFVSQMGRSQSEADALATLTLAVLDGLSVREQRNRGSESSAQAFDAFCALLSK